jgi:disulfide oxidoreductase YuzD
MSNHIKKTFINPTQIVEVSLIHEENPFHKDFYSYKKYKEYKLLGFVVEKILEGHYIGGDYYEKLPNCYFVKEGRLYLKPYVFIKYSNSDYKKKYFDTYQEAEHYFNTITNGYLNIK